MISATALRTSGWRRAGWLHPEWWSLGLSAAAWLMFVYRAAGSVLYTGYGHSGHVAHRAAHVGSHWDEQAFWWLVMVAAMMFPLVRDSIRTTAVRSLWRRRHRAIGGFLIGYFGPWLIFGVVASGMVAAVRTQILLLPTTAAALGFGVALLWQITGVKRRAMLSCHRTMPLAPVGWRAHRDCLHYGWVVGRSCVVSCWALMLACMLSGHSLPAMLSVTAVGWAERNIVQPNNRLLCAFIAVLALGYGIAPHNSLL